MGKRQRSTWAGMIAAAAAVVMLWLMLEDRQASDVAPVTNASEETTESATVVATAAVQVVTATPEATVLATATPHPTVEPTATAVHTPTPQPQTPVPTAQQLTPLPPTPGSASAECSASDAPDADTTYRVFGVDLDDPEPGLRKRSGPGSGYSPVGNWAPDASGLVFIDCAISSARGAWWQHEDGSWSASNFLRPGPGGGSTQTSCVGPSQGVGYTVVRVNLDDPEPGLRKRSGPGSEYSPVGNWPPGASGLLFVDCAISSRGGVWWQHQDGSWSSSNFLDPTG